VKKRKRKSRLRSGKRLGVAGVSSAEDARRVEEIVEEGIFTGELMTCVMCGAEQQSDPDVESDWRCIEVCGVRGYACPDEFPPDGAGKEEFEEAYLKVLARIFFIRGMEVIESLSSEF
jgi:hypothetical protein